MKLTDRKKSLAGPQLTDLLHIVKTGDTSQDSAGSSFKSEIGDYTGLFPNKFVSSGTYSNGTATFTYNSGGTFNVSGFFTPNDDVYVSGLTFSDSNYVLTADRHNGTSLTVDLSSLASDIKVTGGTYDASTGTATFTDNSGASFPVTGFLVVENKQKEITGNYTLTNDDYNYTILINNGANPVTITIPAGLSTKIQIGFIQEGTGDVSFVGSGGVTIRTPITGAFKIKGINYNAYLEQITNTNVYHLLGNIKV